MKTKVNFLASYRICCKKSNEILKKRVLLSLPIVALVLACAAAGIYMGYRRAELSNQLFELRSYLTDENTIATRDAALSYMSENDSIAMQNEINEAMIRSIESYPLPSSGVVASITALGERCSLSVAISSYTARSGTVEFTATSEIAENINIFVADLLESDLFADVNYSGYSYNTSTNLYHVSVTCAISENAGKQ